ncbi:MAG: aldose 1-epimerase family protein [Lachnospirales bacterium]
MLHNEFLELDFNPYGGELTSIYRVSENSQQTWKGDASIWNRSNPVLFPFVSAIKDNEYIYDGKTYKMAKHGFARDQIFEITNKNNTSITFTLEENEETLKIYPFSFKLDIKYILDRNKVITEYKVTNTHNKEIYFNLGGHPSLMLYGDITNNYVEFDKMEDLNKFEFSSNSFTGEKVNLCDNVKELPLNYDLFCDDAILLNELNSKKFYLRNVNNNKYMEFEHNFDYFAIWTKDKAPFICFEPWNSHPDFINESKHLTEKRNLVKLAPKEVYVKFYSIRVF